MNEFLSTSERRLTLRLLAYWEKLRKDQMMPSESQINRNDISDLWNSCFMFRIADMTAAGCRYQHMGDAITLTLGTELPINPNKHSAQVVEHRKPFLEGGEYKDAAGKLIRYRQCLLPLGENGQVSAIFGGVSFKVV